MGKIISIQSIIILLILMLLGSQYAVADKKAAPGSSDNLISADLSDGLLFKPLTANVFEARTGAFYESSDEKLRLDIGASLDLFQTYIGKQRIRIGGDFFTYTRLRSEGRLKFPVETSDYFFGVNMSTAGKIGNNIYTMRLRISHISSHLVDGYSDNGHFDKQLPFTYSREFLDYIFAYHWTDVRVYGGASYIFSTSPDDVKTFIPELGFDYKKDISDIFRIVGGIDFKMGGSDEYLPIYNAQAGIMIKSGFNDLGLLISCYYYDGPSMHGMFYTQHDSYFGIGFQLMAE